MDFNFKENVEYEALLSDVTKKGGWFVVWKEWIPACAGMTKDRMDDKREAVKWWWAICFAVLRVAHAALRVLSELLLGFLLG